MTCLQANGLVAWAKKLAQEIAELELAERVDLLNAVRRELHAVSPFAAEPVDCVVWVKAELVEANDYNPNRVAPPEMELLRHSIEADGYTQPVVSWERDGLYEVVDGFHRNRVARECASVKKRIHGYLPLSVLNDASTNRNNRIAATIRHNRARGKHQIDGMSDIVVELKRRNWTNSRIRKELGMEEDEVLRLCQITGLVELFSDEEFSRSWDVEGEITATDFGELTDDPAQYREETEKFRTVNTGDENRVFHTYEKWECYKAGFYATTFNGKSKGECERLYGDFLADTTRFADALERVITEWKYSCEHYLTNTSMNRIAWLGQAAMCYATGVPSVYCAGYYLLSKEQRETADNLALDYLNRWLSANGREPVVMKEAQPSREMDLY